MTYCPGPLLVCLALTLSQSGGAAQARPETEKSPALLLWEQGTQTMLAGQTDEAMALFRQSLQLDPDLACNHLSLAAGYLGGGDDEAAAEEMDRYLELQPDHLQIRDQYADVLVRLKQYQAARTQLERFVAEVQEEEDRAVRHLVSSHSKLMQIARAEEDSYAECLNRGIGLFWLACQQAGLPSDKRSLDVESLLCRSAAELTQARLSRPDEARPHWYLYEVWTRLAQSQPAQRSLRSAESTALFSYLTPAEQRGLTLAVHQVPPGRSGGALRPLQRMKCSR